ncbi:MAG: alanine--tRNA ligase [Gammaproteobacteria bacterium]|nr:MAG: alanine--tRNA ligase [Gammaproteobacteria bacterium]
MSKDPKKIADIRQAFLDYFKRNDHAVVESSSLVPQNDPTLLFVNAGMVQFKDVFLGADKRPYKRAASSQRCVRAGGKHNDLENVGYTARHHTFFEMLGNFSFGDYFKREAIGYSWEFLTKTLKIPADRLWVTVYKDDDEAADIWLNEIGVDEKRFGRLGEEDNFWSMGDTGPCGPSSEIYYDHGPDVPGGPPGSPDAEEDRYIEIWNLVFMQFDRDASGNMTPLPRPSVDTGMGLERIAAILQGVHSNYEIDLFQNLIKAVARVVDCKDLKQNSLKVIADHIRAASFLINDGVMPDNEGRGYVLRRIIRRAIRHGYELGKKEIFFYKLVAALVKEMGQAYPELKKNQKQIEQVLRQEEERFAETLEQGMKILEDSLIQLKGKNRILPGETAFKLYDTYGFPVDLTADFARKQNVTVDMDSYEKAMDAQRERARAASNFELDDARSLEINVITGFTGYEREEDKATVKAIFVDGQSVDQIADETQTAIVVLDRTPFYAEAGGQVGDRGHLENKRNKFYVETTQKHASGAYLHYGRIETGALKVGDQVQASVVDRTPIRLNHSATHLLHAALRKKLGKHVTQKGSSVATGRLRFDFSHSNPMTSDELTYVEGLVNEHIRRNHEVKTDLMNIDDAKKSGAMALFGEKYDEEVRVLSMGSFSVELCGGTHVNRTGDIGLFKIESESGVASGVRRIEALTGANAIGYVWQEEETLAHIASALKTDRASVLDKVRQLADKNKSLEKELQQTKGKLASSAGDDLSAKAEDVNGIKVLAAQLDGADAKTLRDTLDQLKNKLGTAAIVLASVDGDKVSLVAGVSKDSVKRVQAGALVNMVAQQVGGKGGGRPDMAQAGGNDPGALAAALASVKAWVSEQTS